nr:RNA-directed DNA polymerase, eukaryota, nucleotide-binding alpha-beta plait domain protein [Tanacetum cinerariifolium]
VFNLDRLVENLCTIWIGRYHLYANSVQFERSHKSFSAPTANATEVPKKSFVPQYSNARPGSYANVVNGASPGSYGSLLSTSPAMVLKETCLVVRDLSKHVMGKDNVISESRPSLSHLPGFTPEGMVHHEMLGTVNGEVDNNGGKDNL